MRKQINSALRAGAKAHIDPRSFAMDKAGTPYMAPQVLTNVNHQMSVMMEESFGPVVGIMKVADDAEAIELMNDSPYGLTAAIWTEDAAAAQRIGDEIATGTVFMNRCDYLDPALTWTGVKDTGRGATLSVVGYEALTQTQELSPEDQRHDHSQSQFQLPDGRSSSARAASRSWPSSARPMASSRPLFVTDPGLAAMPMVKEIVADVKKAGLGIEVFSDVRPNPVEANIEAGVKAYKAGRHDGVIAFGGGSGLDVGKMIALMHDQNRLGLRTRGHRRLVDQGRCLEDRADHRGADHGGHGLGSGPRRRRHASDHARKEDHLPSGHHAEGGDPRSRTHRGPAAQAHGSHRHGRAGPQSRGLLRALLPSACRRAWRWKACGW